MALLVMAGCVTVPGFDFVWKAPALQFSHTNRTTAYNDQAADLLRYADKSYVVFSGYDGNDNEIYLRVADQFAGHVISATQITSDTYDNSDPHITASRGYLYIVYRGYNPQLFDPNFNIYWVKIRISDLSVVSGPKIVSTSTDAGSQDDWYPQIVHTASTTGTNSRTDIVWESEYTSAFTHTILWNYVTDGGTVGAPKVVSAGTGCPGTSYSQYRPRIARSYPNGNWSLIAWQGYNAANGTDQQIYWRSVFNNTSGFATNCVKASASDSGSHGDVRISSNTNNVSFVAWERTYNAADVVLRPVESDGTVCARVSYLANSTGSDFNPDVASGDVVSDWVHLAWNHTSGSNNQVWYNLYDASDCGAAPTSVNTGGDANGVITLTVSPFPASASAGAPLIGVATSADVLDTRLVAAASPEAMRVRLAQLVENGTFSKAEADTLMADGQITDEEVQTLLKSHIARAEARAQTVDKPASAVGEDGYQPAVARSSSARGPDMDLATLTAFCASEPTAEACQMYHLGSQTLSPQSPSANCGGITAEDAIVVAWDDDQNPDAAWADEGVASSYYSGGCIKGALTDNGPVELARTDQTQDDDPPTRVLITNKGVAHVVWRGFALHSASADDYDIFYAVTHIPVYLPLTLKNY
jgi:hypothetical protein